MSPVAVGPLRVHDRDVGPQRRHDVDLGAVLVRRAHRLDVRVHRRDVALVVGADREEREVRRAGHVPADHPEVRVLLDLQGLGVGLLDPAPDGVQRADARVAEPREDQLAGDAGADHLVVDHVRRHAREREVALALTDDLVAGREADQVGEALDRDGVAVADQLARPRRPSWSLARPRPPGHSGLQPSSGPRRTQNSLPSGSSITVQKLPPSATYRMLRGAERRARARSPRPSRSPGAGRGGGGSSPTCPREPSGTGSASPRRSGRGSRRRPRRARRPRSRGPRPRTAR